jgi:DNA replication protein DnaC
MDAAEAERIIQDSTVKARQIAESRKTATIGDCLPKPPQPTGYEEKRRQYEADRAECERRCLSEKMWREATIPARHADKASAVDRMEVAGWMARLNDLVGKLDSGFIVALLGKRGTGKTQLAACLAWSACQKQKSAKYIKAMDLFRELRACYRSDGPSEVDTVAKFIKFDLLIIDEAHERSDSEWENRTLTNIIDHRYDACRSTLLVSNQTKVAFSAAVGTSIVSRIKEAGEAIECDWESYRK